MAKPWPAPAKLNHFLHITGQREDGYHVLQTVFQFLDLCDELHIRTTEDRHIQCSGNDASISAQDDLVFKAATALQSKSKQHKGAVIDIDKRIPLGGGLGGGSSDAATTLIALNQLWGCGLSVEELAGLGLALGADVPVFVRGFSAWAGGVGERLEPIALPEKWCLLIYPNCPVATAEVFQHPDLTRNSPAITIHDFLAGDCRNDCEAVVRRLYPEVGEALDWLGERTRATLTGTGATVFAGFQQQHEALAVLAELPNKWQGFIAKASNRSPLAGRLAEE